MTDASPTSAIHPPSVGEVLTNSNIIDQFGVGHMGGMRRNVSDTLLVLISDPFKGLYRDRWIGDILHYTGMGKKGDQPITKTQNKTLAEAADRGIRAQTHKIHHTIAATRQTDPRDPGLPHLQRL